MIIIAVYVINTPATVISTSKNESILTIQGKYEKDDTQIDLG